MGFTTALELTLRFEGGYSDNPADPGGATMRGVTQAVYDAWRSDHGMAANPVREISGAELRQIYLERYWQPSHCDRLPFPVDAVHFDTAVNTGVDRAAKILQEALGVPADGIIGAVTLGAVEASDPEHLVDAYLFRRLAWYELIARRRSQLRTFLLGWLARVLDLRAAVLES